MSETGLINYRYQVMLGVGGIGAGSFFAVNGNRTLGREESRGGRFLDRRDYCKLHIISHYMKVLLGPRFHCIPIGKVGDDDIGRRLINEMSEAGLDMRYTTVSTGDQTLFSFCYVYPDGSGGNLTTDDSACSKVDPDLVKQAEREFVVYANKGVALAVPEVPVEARISLLEMAGRYGFFRVASFTCEEISTAIESGIIHDVDLLAINLDEAAAAVHRDVEAASAESIIQEAVSRFRDIKSNILVSITAGRLGSWCWDGDTLHHKPAYPVDAVSTAGAGDAYLSGFLSGLTLGLAPRDAAVMGSLVAGMSVTSPHTIDKRISCATLTSFASECGETNELVIGFLDSMDSTSYQPAL